MPHLPAPPGLHPKASAYHAPHAGSQGPRGATCSRPMRVETASPWRVPPGTRVSRWCQQRPSRAAGSAQHCLQASENASSEWRMSPWPSAAGGEPAPTQFQARQEGEEEEEEAVLRGDEASGRNAPAQESPPCPSPTGNSVPRLVTSRWPEHCGRSPAVALPPSCRLPGHQLSSHWPGGFAGLPGAFGPCRPPLFLILAYVSVY